MSLVRDTGAEQATRRGLDRAAQGKGIPRCVALILPVRMLVVMFLVGLSSCSGRATPAIPPADLPTMVGTTRGEIDVSSLTGKIVFDDTEDIFVMKAGGSNAQQLTNNRGAEFDPMWSPDGMRIVYRDSRRGMNMDDEIYVMEADGSGQTNLTRDPANDWGPAWSPDGTQIAFNSDRTGGLPQLFIMNADGSEVKQITHQEGEYPTWSPDGTQIAFMSSASGYDIWRINADGSGAMQLTDAPGEDGWPAWSPDGQKIVFESQRDDCRFSSQPDCGPSTEGEFYDLWIMNPDGSGQTRLTKIFGQFSAWSPDSKYIVFNSYGGLYIMYPDGSNGTRIRIPGARDAAFADWAP